MRVNKKRKSTTKRNGEKESTITMNLHEEAARRNQEQIPIITEESLCIRAMPLSCLMCMLCGLLFFAPLMFVYDAFTKDPDAYKRYLNLVVIYVLVGIVFELFIVIFMCWCISDKFCCCLSQDSLRRKGNKSKVERDVEREFCMMETGSRTVAVDNTTTTKNQQDTKSLFTIGEDSDESSSMSTVAKQHEDSNTRRVKFSDTPKSE